MSCIQRCSYRPTGDPKIDGPHAWDAMFEACNMLGDNCECKEMCTNGLRAFKDVVNFKLGKPIMYRGNLSKMASFYVKASEGCRGPNCV